MSLRPAYLIFCGVVLCSLGRRRWSKTVFEIAGNAVIALGVVDMVVSGAH